MKNKHIAKRKMTVSYGKKPPETIRWGMMDYDGISLALGISEKGAICRLEFADGKNQTAILSSWKKSWPCTEFKHDPKAVATTAQKITKGSSLNLQMIGTEFQCTIWKNLLKIPSGKAVTYAELARRSKRPKAVRAAGTACGANPVPILVPCHRVIASNGGLGGFGGGLPTKKKLLKAEGFQQF